MGVLRAALLGAVLAVVATGCGGPQAPRTGPSQVRFLDEPATARVYLDDRFLGAARVLAQRPASFRQPGVRYFTIRARGYFPHDVAVELTPGVTTVQLSLRPVPP